MQISLDPLHPTQSTILEILAQTPGKTAEEILSQIKKESKISKSSLYRLIAQMLENQILVKDKNRLSLNYMWASHFQSVAQSLQKNYFSDPHVTQSINLKEGEIKTFYANSLSELDPTWNHLLIAIKELHPEIPFYAYNAHTTHAYSLPKSEIRLCQNCTRKGGLYFLFGNKTFLDVEGAKVYAKGGAQTQVREDHPFCREGYHFWVCADYILEVVFPPALIKYFEVLFQTVKTQDDFDPDFFQNLFNMKIKCKLTLRRSKEEAEKRIQIFQKLFGEKFEY